MSTKTLLDDAVERGFNELDKMDVGSEEYVKTIDPLTRLSDRLIELEKLDLEKDKQYDDKKLRLKEMKQEQLDRYIKHGLTAISVIGGIALTVWGAKASWKFEETGTITSTPGRKFIGNLFFKK